MTTSGRVPTTTITRAIAHQSNPQSAALKRDSQEAETQTINKTQAHTIHVLLVTSWFASLKRPYLSPYLKEFIERLTNHNIQVSLFAPHPPIDQNSKHRPIYTAHQAIGPIGFAKFLSILITEPRVIVHVQAPNTYTSIFILLSRLLRRPVVATIHRGEVLPYCPLAWKVLRRISLKMLSMGICVSNSTQKLAEECGCSPNRTIVIYNTVQGGRFKPRPRDQARRLLNLPIETRVILNVGDLRPEKGTEGLLRAFAEISDDCILIVVGDGVLRERLETLAENLRISKRVLFLGKMPHESEKLPLLFNAADVFVLPSLIEGHSLALLEALASGLPSIATEVGGNLETIRDGENGFLVPPGDVQGLQHSLSQLLSSDRQRQRLAEAAHKSYEERFSEDEQINRSIKLYKSLLKVRNSATH